MPKTELTPKELTYIQKIENWKALYNSIQGNIQVASQKLSDIFAETEKKQEVLNNLNKEILAVSGKLTDLKSEQEYILRQTKEKEVGFERDKTNFTKERENILNQLYNKEREIEGKRDEIYKIERLVQEKIKSNEEIIRKLDKEIKERNTEINKKENQLVVIEDNISRSGLKQSEAEKSVEDLNKKIETLAAEHQNLKNEKERTEKEIFQKQRSLDSFKENKLKVEEELSKKMKDLQILEGRLRKQFQKLGQDFKL